MSFRSVEVMAQPSCRRRRKRRALTIVEMLVATTVTLLLVYALAQAFAVVSETVSHNRATVEMSGTLRGVAFRLQRDLEGVTAPVRPWPDLSGAPGYLEVFEGPRVDYNYLDPAYTQPSVDTSFGDYDDILMFTARNLDELFVGRVRSEVLGLDPAVVGPYQTVTSKLAEIIWWAQLEDTDGNGVRDSNERYRLHRRVLLIRPDLNDQLSGALLGVNVAAVPPASQLQALQAFHNDNDLSVHAVWTSNGIVANSLEDLTQRENRFAHQSTFPGQLRNILPGAPPSLVLLDSNFTQSGDFVGEDLMLPHLLAWDLRVFDPGAEIRQYDPDPAVSGDEEAVSPGDPGFETAAAVIGNGAFVDLNYANSYGLSLSSAFSGIPQPRSQLYAFDLSTNPPGRIPIPTYCTWSMAYEHDGVNQDTGVIGPNPNPITVSLGIADVDPTTGLPTSSFVDEATDGLDNDRVNGVDDLLERETAPPYPVPLRGIQAQLRIIDPDTRQVRQQTVVADFTPE